MGYTKFKIRSKTDQDTRVFGIPTRRQDLLCLVPGKKIGSKMVRGTILWRVSGGTFDVEPFYDSPISCLPSSPAASVLRVQGKGKSVPRTLSTRPSPVPVDYTGVLLLGHKRYTIYTIGL